MRNINYFYAHLDIYIYLIFNILLDIVYFS